MTQPSFRLYLLGAFRLERDGETVSLSTRKVASLLTYLVLHPQEHAREKIAALLWGDSTDEAARRSLRVALSNLRAQLGADAILSDALTVQFNPQFALWVDARELQRGEWSGGSGELSSLHVPLSTLHTYSDLLPDFYDEWIFEARENLRAKFIAHALQLVQTARGASEYERAIEVAQKILQVDRANEAAHQHLIFCYVVSGKRNAALEQYAACERALREELAVEPSEETRALEAWIRQAPSARAMAGQITNLPIPLSSFVGRQSQVREIKRLLTDGGQQTAAPALLRPPSARLVTLLGAGGSGKTRLAIQVGTELVGAGSPRPYMDAAGSPRPYMDAAGSPRPYPDGVWWVELAALNDPALVTQTIARALGVSETSGEPLRETVLKFLREKNVLLILDNCEHLIEVCARVVDEILTHCANVTILTTSREALNLYGEAVWNVPTLEVPRATELSLTALMMEYEAVRLFVERARAVNGQFALTEQNAFAVALICRRLDGIPLALELAAARVRALSVEQIAARLDDRFQLLTHGARPALPRQQTLRALIDWSYDLLTESERILFARLSVFAGGWTLEAAEQLCSEPSSVGSNPLSVDSDPSQLTEHRLRPNSVREITDVLDLLTRLVDKSLVIVDHHDSQARYHFLETIRAYARERLAQSESAAELYKRHLDFFTQLAESIEPQLWGSEQAVWADRLEVERDNLRAALEWASENDPSENGSRLLLKLGRFWLLHNHFSEGLEHTHKALAQNGSRSPLLRAKLERMAGDLAWRKGDAQNALEHYHYARDLCEQLDDQHDLGYVLLGIGIVALEIGDHSTARANVEKTLQILRAAGDSTGITLAMVALGEIARCEGHYGEAKQLHTQCLEVYSRLGDVRGIGVERLNLGLTYLALGEYEKAYERLTQSNKLFQELGEKQNTSYVLEGLALIALARNHAEQAVQLLAAVEALVDFTNHRFWHADLERHQQALAHLRERLSETSFARAWDAGHALTLEQAIQLG